MAISDHYLRCTLYTPVYTSHMTKMVVMFIYIHTVQPDSSSTVDAFSTVDSVVGRVLVECKNWPDLNSSRRI